MNDLPTAGAVQHPALAGAVRQRRLFLLTVLLGSFLLFLVQPMVARMALPRLGGAPAVWNSAMLVYQALLLGGYAYAHALGRLSPGRQAAVHLAVLLAAGLWLPIGLAGFAVPPTGEPALWVPLLLGTSIGPLFFAVSAQAPLMQRWFAIASGGADPYALYAASNLGSFGGLIAYPLLVEPNLALSSQSLAWSAGYIGLAVLAVACAWQLRGHWATAAMPEGPPAASTAPGAARTLTWIVLALVPSGLMLATTTFLTTDIVAVPMLWVLPLGLYLLSFTVAFATWRPAAFWITKMAPVVILVFGGIIMAGQHEQPFVNAAVALALLFVIAVALHARMYDLRPDAQHLTGFYLAMALGGALGGVMSGLVAPVIFDWTYEYPLLMIAAALLVPQSFLVDRIGRIWPGTARGMAVASTIMLVLVGATAFWAIDTSGGSGLLTREARGASFVILTLLGMPAVGARLPFLIVLMGSLTIFGGYRALSLTLDGDARTRSYFGVYTIEDEPDRRQLSHGTTLHGVQLRGTPARERWPTSYYLPLSGVGRALMLAPALYGREARIGVVGLGTGTLACYAQPGQRWRFYEIDPAVVSIARDSGKFSFLANCLGKPNILLGDARLSLDRSPSHSLDMLVLDAFSSDAVPMHLMTREAFATYARVLSPGGVLLVHISNRYMALAPVVAATAKGGDWYAARRIHVPGEAEEAGATSDWIALTRDDRTLDLLTAAGEWTPLGSRKPVPPWTDDYASILPVLIALNPGMARE